MTKKILFALTAFIGLGPFLHAQTILNGEVEVRNASINRQGGVTVVAMSIDVSNLKIKSNRSVVLTPLLTNDEETQELPVIKILGHKRYIKHQRDNRGKDADFQSTVVRYQKKGMNPINYYATVPYNSWMNTARLSVNEEECGCSNTVLTTNNEGTLAIADFFEPFEPTYIFAQPHIEAVKDRSESGSAYLVFPVNKTEIYPDHMDNPRELARIRSTIDLVNNDADVEIQSIYIKGYASPEGSYVNNERLAKARTESLQGFVQKQYNFGRSLFTIDYEAEDWEGLRNFVSAGDLTDKEGILALIDSDLKPDPKEQKIKSTYPESYCYLLTNCYPALRHSDYTINYTVRGFNVDEAKKILRVRPQKLSLQEMYLVAQTYEPGSEEYNEVFDIAVRMFPEDKVANLNAANVAMMKNNWVDAEKFLAKAGDSSEAIHARGVLAGLKEDYPAARELLKLAVEQGEEGAEENLKKVEVYLK